MPEPFSAETYFATQGSPPSLDADVRRVRAFVRRQRDAGRNVVLVTSGGTTVPLELNVVRFLDNFSAGTRGATSAEYFLKAGYAVIFMHRQFSLQPFSRHYSHSTNPFLDLLEVGGASEAETTHPHAAADKAADKAGADAGTTTTPAANETTNADGTIRAEAPSSTITVTPSSLAHLTRVLREYKAVQAAGTLHTLTFVTVNDYLWLLRAVSKEMSRGLGGEEQSESEHSEQSAVKEGEQSEKGAEAGASEKSESAEAGEQSAEAGASEKDAEAGANEQSERGVEDKEKGAAAKRRSGGRRAMWYLAAAVSDFFLPWGRMSEHKIQSAEKGSLLIEMDQVPKVLKTMVDEWADEGYIVSFKLETDPALLIPKARGALERYGHQVVIGNELNRRKFEVVFVERAAGAAGGGAAAAAAESTAASSAEVSTAKGAAESTSATEANAGGGAVQAASAAAAAESPKFTEKWLRLDLAANPEKEIEEDIVGELVRRHERWIRGAL